MNAVSTLSLISGSVEQTEAYGETIGAHLRGGECIELVSDLGGGKTAFTRGLVRGSGSKDTVASPTFAVSKVYQTDNFDIHHFDFYRLPDAGLITYELQDLVADSAIVTVLEWSNVVSQVLPEERLVVRFIRTGDDTRQLSLDYPKHLQYLTEGLC